MWLGEFGALWTVVKHIKRAAKHLGTSKDVCGSYSGIAFKKKKNFLEPALRMKSFLQESESELDN